MPPKKDVCLQGKGRLAQLAVSHTGSRVVQACVKFGSEAERAQVLAELRPALRELAKSSYAHFTVTKLIAQAPKPDIPGTPGFQALAAGWADQRELELLRSVSTFPGSQRNPDPSCGQIPDPSCGQMHGT